MTIFMVFLTIYYMPWVSNKSQLFLWEFATWIRQCNTIYAMRASDGRFLWSIRKLEFLINVLRYAMQCAQVMEGLLSIENEFLITYSIEIFYFYIYHEDFYVLSNNILHVLGTQLFLWEFATWNQKCNTIYAMRASDGRFIYIESKFSNYLFYRNFLFSRMSWRFLWYI